MNIKEKILACYGFVHIQSIHKVVGTSYSYVTITLTRAGLYFPQIRKSPVNPKKRIVKVRPDILNTDSKKVRKKRTKKKELEKKEPKKRIIHSQDNEFIPGTKIKRINKTSMI